MSLNNKPLLLLINWCVSHHHACIEGWSSLCLRHPGWFDLDSSRGSSGIESQKYLGSHLLHLHNDATTTEHFFMGELQNHASLPAYYCHPFNAQCSHLSYVSYILNIEMHTYWSLPLLLPPAVRTHLLAGIAAPAAFGCGSWEPQQSRLREDISWPIRWGHLAIGYGVVSRKDTEGRLPSVFIINLFGIFLWCS